ncbi:protein kinase, partial [bacterium]|nr:protein kinase [bacterium]
LMVGKTISHYKILEKLGQGGMGVVYKAEDTELKRKVAIKFLPRQIGASEDERKRFKVEAQAAAGLNHPNITTIYNIEEVNDEIFIVMEYIDGEELKDRIDKAPISIQDTLVIAIQIASGLQAAHEKEVIHRDIKSANIMFTEKGDVKIMDFGLAKVRGGAKLTLEQSTLGTAPYMSPEQAGGEDVDHRTDVFSLGVLLYEMLTGQLPFRGDYHEAIIYSILNEEHKPITGLRAGVPMELERIVNKCLQKVPSDRYQGVNELLVDLRQIKKAPELTEGLSRSGRRSTTAREPHRTLLIAGATLSVVILAALWYSFFSSGESQPASERKMLVVLPFENLGPPDDEYFADGLTEEITSRLSYLNGLGVISRTTAMQYKQTTKSIREIGQELGVDYALAGTIRWQRATGYKGKVRVTPQLIRVGDDTHIWSEPFDKAFDEIFEVQSSIAEQVARQLDLKLLEPERKAFWERPTNNMEAYDIYLRALEHYDRGSASLNQNEVEEAIPLLEEAIRLDPGFAHAFIVLFHSHRLQYFRGYDRTDERLSKGKAALDEALRLQPNLPAVHLAFSHYYYAFVKDYDRALETFEYARKLNPNIGLAHLAYIQRRQGEWKKSNDNLIRAFALNPRAATGASNVGVSFTFLRQFNEAEKWYSRALSVNPNLDQARNRKATNYLYWKGDIDAVKAILVTAPKNQQLYINWLYLNRAEIDYENSLKRLARISTDIIVDQYRYIPKDLAYAIVFYLMKDWSRTAVHADSARIRLETEIRQSPNDARYHVALGLAYAYLNRKEEAIQAAERGVELHPVSKDAMVGTNILIQLAEVYTVVGEHGRAMETLEYLLSIPSEISASWLKYDRFWDVLREHPRFQKLLNATKFAAN